MSNLRISPDLFLGSQELNKWQDFIFDEGFVKFIVETSVSYGLVNKNIDDGDWSNFRISQGTNPGTIKNELGFAIDNQGRFIRRAATDNLAVTDDNLWKWIKISYGQTANEPYLVSISADGSLSAPGGNLSSILRGLPNNPVKVSFPNAVTNIGEYQVVEVLDDENATLAGDFSAESNLNLAVVGSFTPDTITPSVSKYPYRYDSCVMTVVTESVLNTAPTITSGEEFFIARFKRNGSSISIEDKRNLNVFKTKDGYDLSVVSVSNNPLIGVEQITFNGVRTTRSENIVQIGFGFRSSNWTINSSTNTLTILGGNGGKYITTADFVDGDFDGDWRVYTEDGKYSIVKQSSVSALQINCVLDTLNPDNYNSNLTQEIHIVPDADAIEIIARPASGQSQITERRFTFPINQGYVKIPLEVYAQGTAQYRLYYRFKKFGVYSQETLFPSHSTHGYLGEGNFDGAGNITGSSRTTYVNGLITLVEASDSYQNRISSVETGDLLGVEYVALNTASDPVTVFQVGTRRQYVVITNDDDLDQSDSDFGTQYSLTADAYLDLRTNLPTTLKNGNKFFIQIRGDYNLNGFTFKIVQDFVNSGDPGIILYELTSVDMEQAAVDNLFIRATFDGDRWFLQKVNFGGGEDTIQFIIDGGGVEITTGEKGHIEVPFDCNIVGWSVLGNSSGSIVVDIWKDTYASFPPTLLDSITGTEKPTLSAASKNQDLALTTWTTTLNKGDILAFKVDSVSTVQRVTIVLKVRR